MVIANINALSSRIAMNTKTGERIKAAKTAKTSHPQIPTLFHFIIIPPNY
jgi:hypothetical protein